MSDTPFTKQGNWMRFVIAALVVLCTAALIGNCQRVAERGCDVLKEQR